MGLFDKAINAAADVAHANTTHHAREQRRRAVDEQLRVQHQAVQWATIRIGRLGLDRATQGVPLPERARPAAEAVGRWQREIAELQRRLTVVDQQLGVHPPHTQPLPQPHPQPHQQPPR